MHLIRKNRRFFKLSEREDKQVTCKGSGCRMTLNFSTATWGPWRQWNNTFKNRKENHFQNKILYPAKLLVTSKLSMKTFSDMQGLKKFISLEFFSYKDTGGYAQKNKGTNQEEEDMRTTSRGANTKDKGNAQSKGEGSSQGSCAPGTVSRLGRIRRLQGDSLQGQAWMQWLTHLNPSDTVTSLRLNWQESSQTAKLAKQNRRSFIWGKNTKKSDASQEEADVNNVYDMMR